MKRKDCDNSMHHGSPGCVSSARAALRRSASALLLTGLLVVPADAGSIRMWPAAVVVTDTIRLSDVCELRGFTSDSEQSLGDLVVSAAPQASGSRVIHMELVRTTLRDAGVNMATVTVRGATRCDVSRPASSISEQASGGGERSSKANLARGTARRPVVSSNEPGQRTLRDAVLDYFNQQLARYGGTADVLFGNAALPELDLAGPDYEFRVRHRNSSPLGLVQVAVEVFARGGTEPVMPEVSFMTQVSLVRRVVSARRAINQGGSVRPEDIELVPVTFTRFEKLGLGDPAQVVGQRAKRFVAAGSLIDASMLEAVPLITRGQLVSLVSVSGAVRVATTATATEEGLLGETITLRATDNRRVEFDAVVTGPGTAQIGGTPVAAAVATRGGS